MTKDPLLKRCGLLLVGLLISFVLLATAYNVASAPFEAPDEIGHFYYVVHLLQTGQLPVVPAQEKPPNYEHEGAQPPLYYAGAAAVVRVIGSVIPLDLDDAGASLDVNPHSTCAQPGSRYNVAYFERDLHSERFPYEGRVRVLRLVRLWSSLLAAATVAGVYASARLAFPDSRATAWFAAGLVALTPEFLFTAGAASNDNMVVAVATWGIYLALHTLRDGVRWSQASLLGSVAGLATLSKASGAVLLPLFLLVVAAAAYTHSRTPGARHGARHLRSFAFLWSLVLLSFLAIAGWWFIRNWVLYHDLTGMSPIVLVERRGMSFPVLIQEMIGVFRSWWGAFGCTAPPAGFHLPYAAIVALALAGLYLDRRRLRTRWPQLAVLACWFALVFIAFFGWNWVTYAPHGRLLYPAVASVAVFLGRGLAHWARRRRILAPLLFILLALGAVAVPIAVMSPPGTKPEIYADPAEANIPQPLDGRFGEDVGLLGFGLASTSLEPGNVLDLTLFWYALAQPHENYSLAIQLVSAEPGATDTLVNFNTWTGGGSYPTGKWHAGDVTVDRYRIAIPEHVERAQGWYVQAILYRREMGARLPFSLAGHPAGDAAILAPVRVGASDPEAGDPRGVARLSSPVTFGQAIALDGMATSRREAEARVSLWWRSLERAASDYVVFVHAYDADGRQIATADGPPLGGGFATGLWEPGDRILDQRILTIPEDALVPISIGVGWYDPVTGVRLAALGPDSRALPDNTFDIPIADDQGKASN